MMRKWKALSEGRDKETEHQEAVMVRRFIYSIYKNFKSTNRELVIVFCWIDFSVALLLYHLICILVLFSCCLDMCTTWHKENLVHEVTRLTWNTVLVLLSVLQEKYLYCFSEFVAYHVWSNTTNLSKTGGQSWMLRAIARHVLLFSLLRHSCFSHWY